MGDLTANFSRHEFDVPEPYPDALVAAHLLPLVDRVQWLRDLVHSPGIVDDTYRSAAHNAAIVGASHTSQHMAGDATDVFFPLVSIRDHAARAIASVQLGSAPAFGQLIFYAVKGHVHISNPDAVLGDRNGEMLVCTGADATGKDLFEPLTDPATQLPVLSTAQKKRAAESCSPSFSSPSGSGGGAAQADGGE